MTAPPAREVDALVIGAGPAGLAAAEALAEAGLRPLIAERMPTPARKFLMAGKSGLNLTHAGGAAEAVAAIGGAVGQAALGGARAHAASSVAGGESDGPARDGQTRHVAEGAAAADPGPTGDPAAHDALAQALAAFPPEAVRAWADGLGADCFEGPSGRVFPRALKASPLLRAWLARLDDLGARLETSWTWLGWDGAAAAFDTPDGPVRVTAGATVLALGGASWPRLGADGGWTAQLGAEVAPWRPANMGFDVDWSEGFRARFAGAPVKDVALSAPGAPPVRAELAISAAGVEGGGVYAVSAALRDALEGGPAALTLDLAPGRSASALAARLAGTRRKDSRANRLRKAGLPAVKAALAREAARLAPEAGISAALMDWDAPGGADRLAAALKALPLPVLRPRPLAEAISSAGGLRLAALDDRLALRSRPGVFCAGEMLDWEAPTGGWLLTTCLASGRAAGRAAAAHARA